MPVSGVDAEAAVRLARDWFVAGRRFDLTDLHTELGISRATLHRWVGNRDQLIGAVCTELGAYAFRRAAAAHTGLHGPERVAVVLGDFVQALADARFFVDFVHAEPRRALRIITTSDGPVQQRVIADVEALLEAELGDTRTPAERHDLAFVIVRIAESFLYTDLITGDPPNPRKTTWAVRELLT